MSWIDRIIKPVAEAAAERAETILQERLAVQRAAAGPSPYMAAPTAQNLQQSGHPVYMWNNPWNFTIPTAPVIRPQSQISIQMLRDLADTYDVARACIEHIKREVNAVPVKFVPEIGRAHV